MIRVLSHAALAVALVLLLPACSSADRAADGWVGTVDTLSGGAVLVHNERGAWDSTAAWRLAEDLRIGAVDGDGPDVFSDVHDLVVDDAGRIYVLQRTAKRVHVFDSTGRFVRAIGRPGKGPGELEFPTGMALDARGRLWVPDPQNGRFTVFDTTGVVAGTHRRMLGGYSFLWDGLIDEQGRLLEQVSVHLPEGRAAAYARFDTAFATIDTIGQSAPIPESEQLAGTFVLRQGTSTLFLFVPFAAQELAVTDPRGFAWSANTGAYRIVQRTVEGDTVRVITRESTPLTVTSDERAAAIVRLDSFARGAPYDPSRIPGTHPRFERLDVGTDGTLWVTLVDRAGAAARRLDVFAPDGRYLGEVRAPAGFGEPVWATGEALYGVVRDELDVPMVVRLRIERGSREPRAGN